MVGKRTQFPQAEAIHRFLHVNHIACGFIHPVINWYYVSLILLGKPLVLHKKWSFPLRISSVNVTKSAVLWIWSHSLEKFLMENFIFCAVWVRIFCENMYHKDLKFRTLAIWNKPFVPLRNNLYPTLSHHFVFPKSTKRTSFTEEKQTLEVFCKKMCS